MPKHTREDIHAYINDKGNGLLQEELVNEVLVQVRYQPSEILILQEMEASNRLGDSTFRVELENKYQNRYYFLLKYSKGGKEAIRNIGGFNEYSSMVQVLSFRMGKYINLTTDNKDTLALSDYVFNQTYGMSDGNSLLLAFEKPESKAGQFKINIAECGFRTGALSFSFRKKDMQGTPKLSF